VFFVRGLSFKGKEILINPDQVLYVHSVGRLHKRTALGGKSPTSSRKSVPPFAS
jgi:hypothetical protein